MIRMNRKQALQEYLRSIGNWNDATDEIAAVDENSFVLERYEPMSISHNFWACGDERPDSETQYTFRSKQMVDSKPFTDSEGRTYFIVDKGSVISN